MPPSLLAGTVRDAESDSQEETTLYDWISAKDSNYTLDVLVDYVSDHLEKVLFYTLGFFF